jgi:hypothetical protein
MIIVRDLAMQAFYYFDADIPRELTFDDHLRLRRVRKIEKYPSGSPRDIDNGYGWGLEGPLSFVAECVSSTSAEGWTTIKKLAICLLLYKRDIGPNDVPWFRLGPKGSRMLQSNQLPALVGEELDDERMELPYYYLKVTNIDDFRAFWVSCNQSPWHSTLLVAGNRLLQAQARVGETVFEDRLIDMMIDCEALVLKGEHDKGETIAKRMGKLLGLKYPKLEDQTRDALALAYRLRNDVVHDGQFSASHLSELPTARLDTFVVRVEQYLRSATVDYIDLMNQAMSKDQIIQYLDSLP